MKYMFQSAFSGFSVDDLAKAKAFYQDTLGLSVDHEKMADGQDMELRLHLPETGTVFVYPKENHTPATFTILNFVVEDIDSAVDALLKKGITFEKYEGMHQDEKGITRGADCQHGA